MTPFPRVIARRESASNEAISRRVSRGAIAMTREGMLRGSGGTFRGICEMPSQRVAWMWDSEKNLHNTTAKGALTVPPGLFR